MLDSFLGIRFTPREPDKVADGLARMGYNASELIVWQAIEDLPQCIQHLIFIDRIGLPYFSSRI